MLRKCELVHNRGSFFPKCAGSRPRPSERIGPERVIDHAQRRIDRWPNENAARRARLDNPDTSSAYDANGRKGEEGGTSKEKTNKD
jgi:hypothetical protein